jgi:hypothetical protein
MGAICVCDQVVERRERRINFLSFRRRDGIKFYLMEFIPVVGQSRST